MEASPDSVMTVVEGVIMDTPLYLDGLSEEQARFCGLAPEELIHTDFLGQEHKHEYHWPMFGVTREQWEGLGKPTEIRVVISTP